MSATHFKVIETLDIIATGKTIIQAFSGSGMVASIVANHLIDELDFVEKGYVSSNLIPSVGIVDNGIIRQPIRIFESQKYVLILSEIAIDDDNLVIFVEELFNWYMKKDPASLVIVGALPTGRPNNAKDLRYNVVTSDIDTREYLAERGIWTMPQGAIYGSVALSLMEARRSGLSAFCILSHCIATIPDYLAAKKVVEVLNIALDESIELEELNNQADSLRDHLVENEHHKDEYDADMDSYEYLDEFEDYDDFDDDDEEDDLSEFI